MAVESKLMKDSQLQLEPVSGSPVSRVVVAATFTAEPIEEALAFWMEEIGWSGSIEFAPYNQVFQQLLDPNSLLSKNRQGINIVLLRLEDWLRFQDDANSRRDLKPILVQNAADLISAVRSTMARSSTPLIVTFCPNSPAVMADPDDARGICGDRGTNRRRA